MKERNRFSGLLKHLMTVAKLKNSTLAKQLQYDESYISKWATGSLLPTEKTSEKILRDIAQCVVTSVDDDGLQTLYSEYQLDNLMDLEEAVFDNLMAEFNYVIDLKETTGSEVAQKTNYYPELTLAQYMQKMRHPVLRQVKSLDVIMVADILSLDRNYQLTLAELDGGAGSGASHRNWPGVRFTMVINPASPNTSNSYDVLFLLNLLTNLSNVDFQLYATPQAQGKMIFAVRDAYAISGMIIDETHCISVTASEDPKNANAIFDRVHSLCTQETLAVRRVSMSQLLRTNEYTQYTFARNQRWLLSHVTEHTLPDHLFAALLDEYCKTHQDADREKLLRLHKMSRSVLEGMNIKILLPENAVSDFAVSGMVDFFNNKFYLTPEQRLEYLEYISTLAEKNPQLEFRVLREGIFSDLQQVPSPTLFLSDGPCHLRLSRSGPKNNMSILNRVQLCDQFRQFFDELWASDKHVDTSYIAAEDMMRYARQMVKVQIMVES